MFRRYCLYSETLAKSASIICDIGGYEWGDGAYMAKRGDILKKGAEKGHFYSVLKKTGRI